MRVASGGAQDMARQAGFVTDNDPAFRSDLRSECNLKQAAYRQMTQGVPLVCQACDTIDFGSMGKASQLEWRAIAIRGKPFNSNRPNMRTNPLLRFGRAANGAELGHFA